MLRHIIRHLVYRFTSDKCILLLDIEHARIKLQTVRCTDANGDGVGGDKRSGLSFDVGLHQHHLVGATTTFSDGSGEWCRNSKVIIEEMVAGKLGRRGLRMPRVASFIPENLHYRWVHIHMSFMS